MYYIKSLLTQFPMTYTELSHLTLVHVSLLKNTVHRDTPIPVEHELFAQKILSAIEAAGIQPEHFFEQEKAKSSHEVGDYRDLKLRIATRALEKAEEKLSYTRAQYQNAAQKLCNLQKIKENLAAHMLTEHTLKCISSMETNAHLTLEKYGQLAQLKLQRKISRIQADISCLKHM